jgi:hypothetical protein
MKTLLKILCVVPLMAFSMNMAPMAAIEWKFTEYDFGTIAKNKPVSVDFEFKNPGMIPLIIIDVKSSCGCTVPSYPKEPIPPGGSGKITVAFDAKDSGYFSKTVTVTANTEDSITQLYIKGEVK